MKSRERAEREIHNLQWALFHAAHAYPGGVAGLAGVMQRGAQVLRNKLNPNTPTAHPTSIEAELVMEITRDERILQAVCAIYGVGYFPLPDIECDDGTLYERSADMMREVSDLMTLIGDVLDDNRVTRSESARLEKAKLELVAAVGALVRAVEVLGGAK